jgi:hypothetical protein
MENMRIIVGLIATVLIVIALWRKFQRSKLQREASEKLLFSDVISLFKNPSISDGIAIGSRRCDGEYAGENFQLQTITDTLAVRKLPSLWLMVTLPSKLPVTAKLNMMMRPAGPTSFSNFDFLDHMISAPAGFPEHAVLRSDKPSGFANLQSVKRHLSLFANTKFKELLITPQGLRIVMQAAEADRAYYGVLRNARFNDTRIDPAIVKQIMDTLLALKTELTDDQAS